MQEPHVALDASPIAPPASMAGVVRALSDDDSLEPSLRTPELAQALGTLFRHVLRARLISARMITLQRSERIGFHTSSIGEEAAIVGAALAARSSDWVFPGARDWYAALARGMPVAEYVHHAFGSADDPTRGHASPDHAPARRYHVVPPSGVVGAHLPQAVGAAWAAKIRKDPDTAAIALFGSEVASSGDFHNALNFAGVFKAPVVLACRAPSGRSGPSIAERAVAYGLASARVDGADALAVFAVVRAALLRAGAGKGATLIEMVLPPRSVAAEISEEERFLDLGPADPLARLRRALVREKPTEAATEDALRSEVRMELDAAVASAERAGAPSPSTIFDHVYAGLPAHLVAQRRSITGG